jgi:hypothetical protein
MTVREFFTQAMLASLSRAHDVVNHREASGDRVSQAEFAYVAAELAAEATAVWVEEMERFAGEDKNPGCDGFNSTKDLTQDFELEQEAA